MLDPFNSLRIGSRASSLYYLRHRGCWDGYKEKALGKKWLNGEVEKSIESRVLPFAIFPLSKSAKAQRT
jgi:hypothetical protein